MKIKIAARLRPFSHTPGASCAIPGTDWELQAFPTLLRFGKGKIDLHLELTGPVEEFTLEQDLESRSVRVFGRAKEGYYRLKIEATDAGFDLIAEKTPAKGISTSHGLLKAKQKLHLSCELNFRKQIPSERLSLGNHKAQDFDLIQRRSDLRELLPLLFCLGQMTPSIPQLPLKGTARLLELPAERTQIYSAFQNFFRAAFSSLLVPRLIDEQYQGLVPNEPAVGNPFFLIKEGAKKTRSLFFQQNERRLTFLPLLPPELHSGRMLHLQAKGIGEIDLEWTKKLLRRMIVRTSISGEVVLELPKGIDSFRVRKSLNEKGKFHQADEPLLFEAGTTYYLDRFQK